MEHFIFFLNTIMLVILLYPIRTTAMKNVDLGILIITTFFSFVSIHRFAKKMVAA